MAWDRERARAETAWTNEDLCRREPTLAALRGRPITLDLLFRPDGGAPERFMKALAMFGYLGVEAQDETGPSVEVTVEAVAFTAEAIWQHEDITARIAGNNGFAPDGWGFFEPEDG